MKAAQNPWVMANPFYASIVKSRIAQELPQRSGEATEAQT